MKDVLKTIGTSIKPLYAIPAVVVVVLVVVALLVFGGGGGKKDETAAPASNPSLGFGEGDPSALPGARGRAPKRAPTIHTSGVLDEARREGRLAVAQARGVIVDPTSVRIRVNAAPKQTVTVNWQLGCYKDRHARVGKGEYRTRTPDERMIELPVAGAANCIVTAGAQLLRSDKIGRIKVSIVGG